MFELRAVTNLCNIEVVHPYAERDFLSSRSETSFDHSSPRARMRDHVDRSNSCIYTTDGVLQLIGKRPNTDEFRAWDVCNRPHSATGTSYQCSLFDPLCCYVRRADRLANARITSPPIQNLPGNLRRTIPSSSRSAQAYARGLREVPRQESSTDQSRSRLSSAKARVKRFKHFRQTSAYIEQYRTEYTYRKLSLCRDSKTPPDGLYLCSCGNTSCSGIITTDGCTQQPYAHINHLIKAESKGTNTESNFERLASNLIKVKSNTETATSRSVTPATATSSVTSATGPDGTASRASPKSVRLRISTPKKASDPTKAEPSRRPKSYILVVIHLLLMFMFFSFEFATRVTAERRGVVVTFSC